MTEIIGRCIGETSPTRVSFVSKESPSVGEYVYLKYADKTVLGMIDSLFRGNTNFGEDTLNPETIEKILTFGGDIDHYIKGEITILGDKDNMQIPKIPAAPGTIVYKADSELLLKVFEKDNSIKIGTLVSESRVPVKIDVNKMVSRHLAILAMTGAGKSNTTSIIIDRLLEVNGTILVFDMHGEYERTTFVHGESNIIKPLINPRDLNISEYKRLALIGDNAVNQEKYFRDAYKYANNLVKEGENNDFINTMIHNLHDIIQSLEDEDKKRQSHIDAARQVEFKLEDMKDKYYKILESTDTDDIVKSIEPGRANIINLSNVDEIATDIVVNHVLNNILTRRKKAVQNNNQRIYGEILEFPIFCIIEEAHMIASEKRKTRSKGTISKIAREGRKFGVGLCLVSQSPKSLDSDSLSQVNNMIILRLVEPGDQSHVQRSSESLSEDLLKQLPSLNTGEAIVLGQMINIPTMVKIDEFKGKHIGNDLDILSIWKHSKEEKEEKKEKDLDEIDELF